MNPGPYDPCSCGSGKKYKFCCAGLATSAISRQVGGTAQATDNRATVTQWLQQGLADHQAGRLAEAEASYRRVIAVDPRHADALHLLGALAYQVGQFAPAIDLIGRAIAINPRVPDFHANLGHALKDSGRLAEAEASYRIALQGRPGTPEVLNNLGLVLQAQGRLEQAITSFEQAIEARPQFLIALMNLGAARQAQGDLDSAENCYRQVLALNPGFAQALNNLGTVLQARGRLAEARQQYEEALRLQPDYGDALTNLGSVLELQGETQAALSAYQRAIALGGRFDDARLNLGLLLQRGGELGRAIKQFSTVLARDPAHAKAHFHLGVARQDEGRLADALAHYSIAKSQGLPSQEIDNNLASALSGLGRLEHALALLRREAERDSRSVQTRVNIGANLFSQGRFEEAMAVLELALELEPGHLNAKWNIAMIMLATGRFPEMWDAYEWRLARELNMFGKPSRPFNHPLWQGQQLAPGSTLLIFPEQGVGDELWAAGMYAEVLAGPAHEARVVIECRPKLLPLFKRTFAQAQVVPWSDPPDPKCEQGVDWQIAGSSLGQFMRRDLKSFPAREATGGAYLLADPARETFWRQRIGALKPGLKVGICWRSSNNRGARALSCTSLLQWQRILATPGVCFVNLQYDECETELKQAEQAFGTTIQRFPEVDMYDDLDETAALMRGLDLVISAPTSVSIMSAALGVPTWQMDYGVLTQLHGLANNPWYPAMRNYVRRWDQRWEEVLNVIGADLAELAGVPAVRAAASREVKQVASHALFARILQSIRNGEQENARAWLQSLLDDADAGYAATALLADFPAPGANPPPTLQARLARSVAAVATSLPEFVCDLGNVYRLAGLAAPARTLLEIAVRIEPGNAVAWEGLGLAAQSLGDYPAAINALEQAVLHDTKGGFLKAELAEALDGLAMRSMESGANDEACKLLARATSLNPQSAEMQFHFGCALQEIERYDEATSAYRRTVELRPDFAPAWNNLANTLRACRRLDEAIDCFRKALAVDGDLTGVRSNLLLTMNYAEAVPPGVFFAEHLEYARRVGSRLAAPAPFANGRDTCRRLRIGYVSADFRTHPITRFLEPIIAGHDRGQFEIFCYASSTRSDQVTERLRAGVDGWRIIAGVSDDTAAKIIRDDAIDVLIDLSGHTALNRLPVFARRPAPVQASYLGYPATTGLSQMDYKIVDALTAPEEAGLEAMHTEKLRRLDGPMWAFSPDPGALAVSPPPVEKNGFVTFGSFNSIIKVGASAVRAWAEILRQVPHSRLMLATVPPGETRARLDAEFSELGVDPSRLTYHARLQPAAFWELYSRADVALDSFPCNGGTTTFETLWMGVPVLALAGAGDDILVSRVSAGILQGLGLDELVAQGRDDYVRRAVELARDKPRLAALRRELRERLSKSAYMNHAAFVADLERAYRAMWQRWLASQMEEAQ